MQPLLNEIVFYLNKTKTEFLKLKGSHQTAIGVLVFSFIWIASGVIFNGNNNQIVNEKETFIPKVQIKEMVAEETFAEIILKGRTRAKRIVTVKAETNGTISKVISNEGDLVSENDVLVIISEDARATKVNEAKSLLEQRTLEFTAAKNLSKSGFNSQVRLAEVTTLLNSAKANLAAAKLDLEHTNIKAPFTGVLNNRLVEVGDFVNIGTPIATVVDLNPIILSAEVSELEISSVETGKQVLARLVDGQEIAGIITYISRVASDSTRTYRIDTETENPYFKIAEGMTAELVIPLAKVKAFPISPAILTLSEKGDIGVKIVDENDIVVFKKIKIVRHDSEAMWIGGLPDKIRLIVTGSDFVREGERVIAVPVNADAMNIKE